MAKGTMESALDDFPGFYSIASSGVAFFVLGWEMEPNEETEWSGCLARTGRLGVVMVGDDRVHFAYPDDLTELSRGDFCSECGQIGCRADAI